MTYTKQARNRMLWSALEYIMESHNNKLLAITNWKSGQYSLCKFSLYNEPSVLRTFVISNQISGPLVTNIFDVTNFWEKWSWLRDSKASIIFRVC